MRKMVKFLIALIVCGTVVYSAYRISQNNQAVDGDNQYLNVDVEVKNEILPVKQVREQAEKTIQDLKDGKYEKLTTKNPFVYITKEDVLHQIVEKSNTIFRDKSLMEILESELEVVKSLIGADLDMEKLVDDTSWYYIEGGDYETRHPTYAETVENIKNNVYQPNDCYKGVCDWPYLGYVAAARGGPDKRYCHVPPDMDYTVFMRGKLFEIVGAFLLDPELDNEFEYIRTYYRNDSDLDDSYKLSNGEISVREGIQFTENYFANLYPYNMFPENKEVVHHVTVLKIRGIYVYEFALVKEYAGLISDTRATMGRATGEVRDDTRAVMVETDKIDMRIGSGNAHEMKKDSKELKEIISLDNALKIISNTIGKNSRYEVEEISMMFRRDAKEKQLYIEHYVGVPHWMVKCTNPDNGNVVSFYVKMDNGYLSYVQEN